jgi:hypothetical protein
MKKIIFSHCIRKAGLGGEDFAIERICNLSDRFDKNIYHLKESVILSSFQNIFLIVKFIFSLNYFFYVKKNQHSRHIICNPFPNISLLSIFLLGFTNVPLRIYVHNFSLSCISGRHYAKKRIFMNTDSNKYNLSFRCAESPLRYALNFIKYFLFYKLFFSFNKNKAYFVSPFQAELAKNAGLVKSRYIIAGNVTW